MKKLLIGLTLLTSVQSFAATSADISNSQEILDTATESVQVTVAFPEEALKQAKILLVASENKDLESISKEDKKELISTLSGISEEIQTYLNTSLISSKSDVELMIVNEYVGDLILDLI